MLSTLSKKKAKRTKRTKRPKRYQLPRGMTYYTYDLFCGPVQRPGVSGLKAMKLHMAEVLWLQRTVGQGAVSIEDWHFILHPHSTTNSADRGWERFKANLIRWQVPHDRNRVHFARINLPGDASRVDIVLQISGVDEWFRDRWGYDFEGDEEEEELTEAEYHLITALDLLRRFRASHLRWGVRCDCDICKQTKELIQKVGVL